MSGWLELTDLTLASGRRSSFKVECDDLTDGEVAAACAILARILPPFASAVGVPTGGLRVADALEPYRTPGGVLLVVDDVWTTGGSMLRFMAENDLPGHRAAVLFARGPVPSWVTALWTLNRRAWEL